MSSTPLPAGQRPPVPAGDLPLVVRLAERIADGVVALVLARPDGTPLPAWEPGAHLDICLPGLTRQYSLCGDPADRSTYRIGVLLEASGRGGSRYVHEKLHAGAVVMARRPRNRFPLVDAGRYLFVAGGIGITPLLPMLAAAHAPWTLLYGGRTRSSMAFLNELGAYGDQVQVRPQDEYGLLDLDSALRVPAGTAVYCCGPEPLIAAVEQRWAWLPHATLHLERFAARVVPDGALRAPFSVHCMESDLTVEVNSTESMLDALLAAGVDLNYDCREGTCGTCELALLSGQAEHLDAVLGPEECEAQQVIFPCVSRSRTPRLVVDA